MLLTRGDDRFRLLMNQVIHDGEIVRGKVPDYVGVILEHPKVDAYRVVVVKRAQRIVFDELVDLPNCGIEQERVVHHDLELLAIRQIDEFFRLANTSSERLFDKDMFAVFERFFSEWKMVGERSNYRDGVDVG